MSYLLQQYSMPADRAVGCTFATAFESQVIEETGGATIYGSPTFDKGIVLDGSNDYIKYKLDGHEFYSDNLTLEQEFWPDFATDEDANRVFFDSTPGNRYLLYKTNNASANALVVYLGHSSLITIPEITYSPHWLVNRRNVLQISSNGTTTHVRLNKNLIGTSVVGWTKKKPTNFYIGAFNSGGSRFKGKIGPVKVYQSLLTERDHYNTYHNCAYGFTNDAVAYFPMTNACHDAANNRTLDVSGNNNHAVWTPGATQPAKNTKRGYYWDGGDHMIAPATGMFNQSEVGLSLEFTPGFPTDENVRRALFSSPAPNGYTVLKMENGTNALRLYLNNIYIAAIPEATYSSRWHQGRRNVLTISSNGSFTDVHLNEGLILDADNTAWTPGNPTNFNIGCDGGLGSKFLGDIHSMMIFDKLITRKMHMDLMWNRTNSIGEV